MTAPDAQREAIYRAAVRQLTADRAGPQIAPQAVVRPVPPPRRRPRRTRGAKVRPSRIVPK